MPSTANQEVQALRVVFGVPKDSGSIDKMERWVREHCRDYRRDDEEDKVVVTMVLHRPMKGQALGAVVVGSMLAGLGGRLLAPRVTPVLLFAAPCLAAALVDFDPPGGGLRRRVRRPSP